MLRLHSRFQALSTAASAITMMAATLVLAGWLLHVDVLKSLLPGGVPMKPNAAVGVLLAGFALWLLQKETSATKPDIARRRLARICTLMVVLISALTLAEYLFGWDLALDQLLFKEPPGAAGTVIPGRMAPNTALSLLAIGCALWLLNRETSRGHRLAQFCGVVAAAIGMLALFGYAYGVDSLSGLSGYSHMALPAALTLVVLAAGLLLARPDRGLMRIFVGEGAGGVMARRLVLPILVVPVGLDVVALAVQRAGLLDPKVTSMIHAVLVVGILEFLALATFGLLERADAERKVAERELQRHREHLEELVEQRTREVAAANESLRREKAISDAVIDSLPGVFYLLDAEGRFVRWNRNFERVTGYSNQEAVQLHALDLFPNDEKPLIAERLSQSVAAERTSVEVSLVAKDGTATPYIFSGLRLALDSGQYRVEVGIDITERRQVQKERDRLFDLSLDMLGIAGFDGIFTQVNPAFSRTLGWSADELTARPFLDFVHPDDCEATIGAMSGLVSGEEVVGFENRYRCRDGSFKWLSWMSFPLVQERLIFAIARDVTQQKQAEEALRRSNETVRRQLAEIDAYYDSAPVGLCVLDTDLRYVRVNSWLAEINGVPVAAHIGRTVREVVPHLADQVEPMFRRVIETGEPRLNLEIHGETTAQPGLPRTWLEHWHPQKDDTGKVVSINLVAEEITERKRSEEEIRRLNADLKTQTARLEAANTGLEAFSYSVSHDLRAPLRAIDGFSRILQEEHAAQLDAQAQRYFGLIREGAQQMGRLIDDLLAFSRLGRQAVRKQRVDTMVLVREVLDELQLDTAGRQINVRLDELAPCHADPALLRQVWMNLLGNAIKFTGKRKAAVIEVGCKGGDGETIYFVKDNGVGFDMAYADKLFGVFQRLHRAKDFGGTGVGLATVKRIVTGHGGRAWAEATVDRGAVFYFTLGGERNDG